MGKQKTADFNNNTITWFLPYHPGKLTAKGYNGDKEVASYTLTTSKNTNKAEITTDRSTLQADGQDLSHISIQLVDENNIPVQTDDRKISISVAGEGRFMGIDNGDLRREKPFAGNELKTYFGKALIIVQSTRKKGSTTVNIKVEGIDKPYEVNLLSV